ncbi:aldo/keto reductase [Streptomyces sp. OfavH-34-F]|uniref:aldo/keto reductase n=1 Tax=Streptomyces sp. OfavH-34-F TaxID=2917760 RepID=UPI001EF2DF62|nr:aldo/keto reductase [Streptomyces sp. OfavH-34-F]MCG7522963.1 aldo/keto reductase [Streptomyces sp. OfavH-34-F]
MTLAPAGAATPPTGVAALGTFEFGTRALPADVAHQLLDTYQELGGRLIDTAPTYGPHSGAFLAEPLIGAWLQAVGAPGMRVITKAGLDPTRPDRGDLRPETILASARRSAERLGRPTILVLHRDDPTVPVGEIADAADRAVGEGLAEQVGASNWTTARLNAWTTYAAAARLAAPALTAPLWSLAARADPPAEPWLVEADPAHLDMAARHGMTLTPYRTLAAGYLAARHSGRHRAHHSAAYDTAAGRGRRARLHQVAAALGMTPHGLALAWLRAHRPAPVIPVIGPRTPEQLAQSMAGAAQADRVTPALAAYLQDGP